jgi:cobalt/nickel transport system permease protein
MHIADGLLSPEVCVVTGAASAVAVGFSLYKLRDSLADRVVPLTGMVSALVFAGQMVNFPIGVPVSGHLLGGVLAAVVVGPWAGCIALTLVLLVQCFLFADGGVTTLGANVLHMAVIGSMGGYAVYSAVRRLLGGGRRATVIGTVVASWLSVMAAAALFCVEFGISWAGSDYNMSRIFTLMVAFHSAIGVGEALITGAVVSFVLGRRPDLLYVPQAGSSLPAGIGRFATAGVVCALAIAAFLAPFASSHPDGLEAVAERARFDNLSGASGVTLLSDYEVPLPVANWKDSAAWERFSVSLAGLLGTGAVLGIALVLGRGLSQRGAPAELPHDQ